jgi:hypothetical protein
MNKGRRCFYKPREANMSLTEAQRKAGKKTPRELRASVRDNLAQRF